MDWAPHMRRILSRLGEDATFTHGSAQTSSVKGIFVSPYSQMPAGLPAGFASSEPRFAAMTEDLPSVEQQDTITRGTVDYKITDIQPDDPSGVTMLVLQKAA
jgi:hypothetical protein